MKLAIILAAALLPATALAQGHTGSHSHDEDHDHGEAKPVLPKKTVPATSISPEYVQFATNIEIIPDIEKAVASPSALLTHEGLFGPLLFAEQNRAFFIELKPGMFLAEHPHPTGSIIYTVRGKWVLASEGKRQVMEAGSLFRFGDQMPTGWEAPFGEGALLLVVKGKAPNDGYETFNKGILSMQAAVDKERKEGTAFYYNALAPNHPAIAFARSVNPDFDTVLKNIKY
jgi:quercetin dioxygenase-like cupin family protein